MGLQRITPSSIRKIIDPITDSHTKVDDATRDTLFRYAVEYQKAEQKVNSLREKDNLTDAEKIELDNAVKNRDKLHKNLTNRDKLAKSLEIESGGVLDSALWREIAKERGNYANYVIQEEKGASSSKALASQEKIRNLLYAVGKNTKEVKKELSLYEKAAENMGEIANKFGNVVANEMPLATISQNG